MAKKLSEIKTNPKPMFYACVLEGLRKIAFKCGYTLAVHGTCASDMDLIAVQWSENYESANYLMEQFVAELSHYNFGFYKDTIELTDPKVRFRHQKKYTIPIIGDWYIDLTVINDEIGC